MSRFTRRSLAVTALLLGAGMAGCTDPTESPTSTVTEDNVFKDARSYRAFLAKLYAGIRTLRLADGPDEVHRRAIARLEFGRYKAR